MLLALTRGAAQGIGIPKAKAPLIRSTFERLGSRYSMHFTAAKPQELRTAVTGKYYFAAEVPDAESPDQAVILVHKCVQCELAQAWAHCSATVRYLCVCVRVLLLPHSIREEERHPLQFGREVVCEVLEMRARTHWKDCALSKVSA